MLSLAVHWCPHDALFDSTIADLGPLNSLGLFFLADKTLSMESWGKPTIFREELV